MEVIDVKFIRREKLKIYLIVFPVVVLVSLCYFLYYSDWSVLLVIISLCLIKFTRDIIGLNKDCHVENIRIRKRMALEKSFHDGSPRVSFEGETKNYFVCPKFVNDEYIYGSMFYIVELQRWQKGKEIVETIGVYPMDRYILDPKIKCDREVTM